MESQSHEENRSPKYPRSLHRYKDTNSRPDLEFGTSRVIEETFPPVKLCQK
jgi:hypothetical protein